VDTDFAERLIRIGRLLVNQERAKVLVEPRAREVGFWFGGGNIARAPDGTFWLVGRYRNGGDARAGIEAGPRGAELALLRSDDGGETFRPAFSFLKKDLTSASEEVVSIEGSCLYVGRTGAELYVSSEKERPYPARVCGSQKPGTGVWSIDVLCAQSVEQLRDATPQPVLLSDDPCWLHVKDPMVFDLAGKRTMIFCSHPYSWSSTNTGYAWRSGRKGIWSNRSWSIMPRGPAWDVAVFRVTGRLPLPAAGVLAGRPRVSLYFYDGAECIHDHGGSRPKGFSCEEIGGLAAGPDREFPQMDRLSVEAPLFVSPHGTGCSRYVSVADAGDHYLVTWQQSQPDRSQPLVVNRVPKREVEALLTARSTSK